MHNILIYKILNKARISHLICVYIGVLIPIAVDVYLLQPIIPASVTAMTSSITLLLALIALAKVNKWLSEKMSNKAFEQTENFLTHFTEVRKYSNLLSKSLTNVRSVRPSDDKKFNAALEATSETYEKMYEASFNMVLVAESLRIWSVKLIPDMAFKKFLHRYTAFGSAAHKALLILEINDKNVREKEWLLHRENILITWNSLSYIQDGISKMHYKKLFAHKKQK